MTTVLVVSDIHYASDAEKARGEYELRSIPQPLLRLLVRAYRHFFWMRDPFAANLFLDQFLDQAGPADYVVANGDYSCDSAFVGVSDDAVFQSTQQCLDRLRRRYGDRVRAVLGDHELGKMNVFGGVGGLRLASWRRCVHELALEPFWRVEAGRYVLLGITSSLVALPIFAPEVLPDERAAWEDLRRQHQAEIEAAFAGLRPEQRVLLFSHDPTALPFLGEWPAVRSHLGQVEHTIIGHLHSNLLLWKSRLLSGLPPIRFLGNTIRRYSTALHHARHWRPFNVRLCPALRGIELLKDRAYLRLELSEDGTRPARITTCSLARP